MVKTWSTPVADEEKQLVPCALCGGQKFKPSLSCEAFSYVRCASCGLVQMNPQPLESEVKRRYGAVSPGPSRGNSYGEDYLSYELANEEAFLNLQLLALEDAGFSVVEKDLLLKGKDSASGAGPRILDIGCATGKLLALLRGKGWETTGVEIGSPQAEYGRRKRNLDLRSLPLEENQFPTDSFDTVLASHLIEHLNDPAALIREVHRILKPQGLFFITTPNIAGFQARLLQGRWRSAIFDHLYLFSVKTLTRLLAENGFIIEKIATWGGLAAGLAPAPLKRIFDKAAKSFGFGDVMIVRARQKP